MNYRDHLSAFRHAKYNENEGEMIVFIIVTLFIFILTFTIYCS